MASGEDFIQNGMNFLLAKRTERFLFVQLLNTRNN